MGKPSITASLLWDRFGIGVSAICAIHCLFVPAIISMMPLWPAVAKANEWLHPVFILLLIPIVFFASKRSHFDHYITLILVFGFLVVTLGWLIGHFLLDYWTEVSLTLAGSLILIFGHWTNYRHHRKCSNPHHEHHPIAEDAD